MNYLVPLVLGSVTVGLCLSSSAAVVFMIVVSAISVAVERRGNPLTQR